MQYIDYLGISKREFYTKTGISRGTLENLNSGITEEIMAKFIEYYPEINPAWLLTGEGKMLRQPGSDGCGDDAVKRAEQLAAENEELRTQLELQKKLLEAKDETIEALQRAVRLLEKQEKVTETRTEVVEGVVGRKA